MSAIEFPEQWQAAIQAIIKIKGCIMVLGLPDTGKSTFCLSAANKILELLPNIKIGLVDADVGQSDIGPPTTIGLATINKPIPDYKQTQPTSLYFVGNYSPEGHIERCIIGTKKLSDKAAAELGCQFIIIDTTGLVHGFLGRQLKESKINLLAPKHLVALQHHQELEHILKLYQERCLIHRLKPSSKVQVKSKDMRKKRRLESYESYFNSARLIEVNLNQITISPINFISYSLPGHFISYLSEVLETKIIAAQRLSDGIVVVTDEASYCSKVIPQLKLQLNVANIYITSLQALIGLIVGLQDSFDNTLGVGIIKDIDLLNRKLYVLSPLQNLGAVKLLRLGSLKLLGSATQFQEEVYVGNVFNNY